MITFTPPSDYQPDLWPSPLEFQRIVGRAIASGCYSFLFRQDGFVKSTSEMAETPELVDAIGTGNVRPKLWGWQQ